MSPDRNAVVERFSEKLLDHFGQDVESVFGFLPSDFQGISPAIAVYVGGTQREKITPGTWHRVHLFLLYFVVIYGVKDYPHLTEEKAQQTLGTLSDKIETFVDENMREDGFWTNVEFTEISDVAPIKLTGRPYFSEIVPLLVHTY